MCAYTIVTAGLIGLASLIMSDTVLSLLSGPVSALVQIVIGVVGIIGSRFISWLVWAIIFLILGIIAGTLEGSLVVIGAILGLLSIPLKSAPK
jgi:hypothetical protein